METSVPSSTSTRFPTFRRFYRWLFSWRMLRRCLIAFAALITLVAIFYTEEGWRGKRAWENYRDQLVAQGAELDWKSFAPPPVPDDQNFAMTPFLAPLFELNPQPLRPGQSLRRDTDGFNRATSFGQDVSMGADSKSVFPEFDQPLDFEYLLRELRHESKPAASVPAFASRADAAAEVLRKFAQFQPVLDELRTASQRPYSRFNVDYGAEDPASILIPHLAVLRRTGEILTYQASAELATGKADAAFDDIGMMFRLADSIRNEPILISQVVRTIMLNDTSRVIREGLAGHLWSDQQLQKFQRQLGGLTLLQDLQRPMDAERAAVGVWSFEMMRDHRPNYFVEELGIRPWAFRLFPTGWIYFEQLSYNEMRDEQLMSGYEPKAGRVHPRTIDEASAKVHALLDGGIGSRIWHHRLFANDMLPFLANIVEKSAAAQTAVDEAGAACALERYRLVHGQYPEKLGALDPQFLAAIPDDVITGEPLKYRLTAGGQFVLYSVGWNETDDGGKIVMSEDGKTVDATQGDWVWPAYPAK